MINIFYESFPDAVTVEDRSCPVVTDFRDWMKFSGLLGDQSIPAQVLPFLTAAWFRMPPAVPTRAHFDALVEFYQARPLRPDSETSQKNPRKPPVFDWNIDAPYLLADFRQFFRIDLIHAGFLHWWEFLSLFCGLPETSQSKKRIFYRGCDLDQIPDRFRREEIRRIRNSIALPYVMQDDEIGAAMTGFFQKEGDSFAI